MKTLDVVRKHNETFDRGLLDFSLATYFDRPDGFYYDPVGDEIFEVTRVADTNAGPFYVIDFGDQKTISRLLDHGLNVRLA